MRCILKHKVYGFSRNL